MRNNVLGHARLGSGTSALDFMNFKHLQHINTTTSVTTSPRLCMHDGGLRSTHLCFLFDPTTAFRNISASITHLGGHTGRLLVEHWPSMVEHWSSTGRALVEHGRAQVKNWSSTSSYQEMHIYRKSHLGSFVTLALAGQCWPRSPMFGQVWPFLATFHGWPWLALVGHVWPQK